MLTLVGVLAAGLLLASAPTLDAQVVPEPPITQMDWQLRTVRASGQPVIPLFEGWYANPDGTYDLCFGFFNLNREEALDIPIGAGQLHRACPLQRDSADPLPGSGSC